jgi:hypothetical protein
VAPGVREAAGAEGDGRRSMERRQFALSERERKGVFSPGMGVRRGLAAFCSTLCAYRWSGYSSSHTRKTKSGEGCRSR